MNFQELISELWIIDSHYFERCGKDSMYNNLHKSIIELEEFVNNNDLWDKELDQSLTIDDIDPRLGDRLK